MKTPTYKDSKIESLRGLALTLMVMGHVIGSSESSGMRVPDDSFLRYMYDSFAYIRMPLFTAISGYVYALRPVTTPRSVQHFLKGKAYRIALPLIVVSTLFFLAQTFIPGTNEKPADGNVLGIYLYGYAHFWFLQAILLIFLAVVLLEQLHLTRTFKGAVTVLIAALLLPLAFPEPIKLFSLYRALDLLPFFLLGLIICRFPHNLPRVSPYLIPTAGLILIAIHQGYLLGLLEVSGNMLEPLGMALGLCATYTLITYRFDCLPLNLLGKYAFEVYLFHVFGTAGTRIVLKTLGMDSTLTVFIISLTAGLLLPIALKTVTQQYAITDLLLFGNKRASTLPLKKTFSNS